MTVYGLTSTGFNQKRQDVILAGLQQALKDAFGEIGIEVDQVFGMLAGVVSEPAADCWEQLAAIYWSRYREGAEGVSLDRVAALVGLTRIQAAASTVRVAFGGAEGTIIPIGTQTQLADAGAILFTLSQVTISAVAASKAEIEVTAVAVGAYTATINGVANTYTAGGGDDADEIATGLAGIINSTSSSVVTATALGAIVSIVTTEPGVTFSITVGTRLAVNRTYAEARSETVETGPIIIPAGAVDTIVTPVSGLQIVTNLEDGLQGRARETDTQLRQRIVSNPNGSGRSTETAIKAELLAGIPGVTSVIVISNRTGTTDVAGRPKKSFEVIIQSPGADDNLIAQTIYNNAPAGIQIVSTSSSPSQGNAVNVNGHTVVVAFSRPTAKRVWLWVDLVLFDEEVFPSDGTDQVAAALLELGNQSDPGIDIIVQKFYRPIYSVPGISYATIYMAVSDGTPSKPVDPAENYTIGDAEIATYDIARITVDVP